MNDGDKEQQQEHNQQAKKETEEKGNPSTTHLTTSGAASLVSSLSVPPPLLSRPSLKSSASQAQGQTSTPTLSIDLSDSTHRLRLSPSPNSRPRSLVSLTTEEGAEDHSFLDDSVLEGEFGSGAETSPFKGSRSQLLTKRLKSAIGEDLVLQKEILNKSSSDEGEINSSLNAEQAPDSDVGTQRNDSSDAQNSEATSTGESDAVRPIVGGGSEPGWGWSTFVTIPSSLRMEAALNTFRASTSASAVDKGNKAKPEVGTSTEGSTKNLNNASNSFGSYMKPLDVRKWWASPSSSSRSASSERGESGSRSGSIRDGMEGQSSKGPSKTPNPESPFKGLPSGSFPAASIAKRNKKKREQMPTELKGKAKENSSSTVILPARGRAENAKRDSDVVEHDLSNHVFGVEGEEERFPEREYLVLSTAGKPIYVSYVSKARLKRAEETKARRRKVRVENVGDDLPNTEEEAEEAFAAEDRDLQDDEDQKAATKVGVLQALISNYESLGSKQLQQRSLDLLDLPKESRICYLLRPPLYLVAISRWGEEESTLRNHLDHLYLAIISLVSASKLSRLFDRAANFDLKRLLDGTDGILDTLLTNLQVDATSLYGSMQPLRIDTALRLDVGSALIPSKDRVRPQDALYALLLSQDGIVTLARRKRKSIHPIDCHLLINTVYATKAMKEVGTQSWVPICLPKFAPQGFLYAHVSFLEEEEVAKVPVDQESSEEGKQSVPDLALVLVTSNPDGFEEMSQWRSGIIETLQNQNLLIQLTKAVGSERASYSADELQLPGLRHFIFKWRSNVQSTSPQFEDPYTIGSDNHKRLVCLYGMAYHYIHRKADQESDRSSTRTDTNAVAAPAAPSSPIIRPKSVLSDTSAAAAAASASAGNASPAPKKKTIPLGQHLIKTPTENIFAWSTPPFELYLTVSPHLPQGAIVNIAKSIVKWVKQEEHRLFIVSAPVF